MQEEHLVMRAAGRGELVNPKDKKGYRLAIWQRGRTPILFD